MQISSKDFFTYDGHQSYLYSLRFAWIDNSPESDMVSEKTYNQTKNWANNKFGISKSYHEEALSFETEIVSDRVLSDFEVRRIYNIFFNRNEYKELVIVPSETGERIHLNCIITDIEKIEGGYDDEYGVVGFGAKILCDAPWGWTDEKSVTFSVDPSAGEYPMYHVEQSALNAYRFEFTNYSDSHEYIYPDVEIVMDSDLSNSSISGGRNSCFGCPLRFDCDESNPAQKSVVINLVDSEERTTCLFPVDSGETTYKLQPSLGLIAAKSSSGERYANAISSTNKKFIRLIPGTNTFWVENVSRIKFNYKEARILV